MSNIVGIDDLNTEEVTINVQKIDNTLVLKFIGRIDLQNPNLVLAPFFNELHEKIVQNGIKEVKCDIRDLHFINSSGIKCLILWILKIPNLEQKDQYNIVFVIDNNVTWQKSSISFLTALIPDKIFITENI